MRIGIELRGENYEEQEEGVKLVEGEEVGMGRAGRHETGCWRRLLARRSPVQPDSTCRSESSVE